MVVVDHGQFDRLGDRRRVGRVEARRRLVEHLGQGAAVGGDHGAPACRGLEHREAEALLERRRDRQRGVLQEAHEPLVADRAGDVDPVGDRCLLGGPAPVAAHRLAGAADDHELVRHPGPAPGLDQTERVLVLVGAGDAHDVAALGHVRRPGQGAVGAFEAALDAGADRADPRPGRGRAPPPTWSRRSGRWPARRRPCGPAACAARPSAVPAGRRGSGPGSGTG